METSEKKQVLILEDSSEILAMYLDQIKPKHDVVSFCFAQTMDDARRLYKKGHFDIIVCDHHLKDGDSLDFIKEIHAGDPGQRMIAVSSDDINRYGQQEAGCCCKADQKYKAMALVFKMLGI